MDNLHLRRTFYGRVASDPVQGDLETQAILASQEEKGTPGKGVISQSQRGVNAPRGLERRVMGGLRCHPDSLTSGDAVAGANSFATRRAPGTTVEPDPHKVSGF